MPDETIGTGGNQLARVAVVLMPERRRLLVRQSSRPDDDDGNRRYRHEDQGVNRKPGSCPADHASHQRAGAQEKRYGGCQPSQVVSATPKHDERQAADDQIAKNRNRRNEVHIVISSVTIRFSSARRIFPDKVRGNGAVKTITRVGRLNAARPSVSRAIACVSTQRLAR